MLGTFQWCGSSFASEFLKLLGSPKLSESQFYLCCSCGISIQPSSIHYPCDLLSSSVIACEFAVKTCPLDLSLLTVAYPSIFFLVCPVWMLRSSLHSLLSKLSRRGDKTPKFLAKCTLRWLLDDKNRKPWDIVLMRRSRFTASSNISQIQRLDECEGIKKNWPWHIRLQWRVNTQYTHMTRIQSYILRHLCNIHHTDAYPDVQPRFAEKNIL